MRLDHIAYRVKDRHKTVEFFIKAFKYKVQTEFDIDLGEGQFAQCFALEPPEKEFDTENWTKLISNLELTKTNTMHLPPEIFVSDGTPNSIIGKWVEKRDGVGGIHHLAYQVNNVKETMQEWKDKGYAEFTTEDPLTCPGLTQVFTKPSELTGVIYEFIERQGQGFCRDNVRNLMISTDNLN
jgi:4-hydroxyphenylpyruvate dioxygenase-like putative hemolysin